MTTMQSNVRKLHEAEFATERNYEQLMSIYAEAIAAVKVGQA
jgi:hypothetical protein